MTTSFVGSRKRRHDFVIRRRCLAAVCHRLRGSGEAELADSVASAADTWFGVATPVSLQRPDTERLADLLVSAGSVLVQDDDPGLGLWAQAAAAALTAMSLAEREATATVRLRVHWLRSRVVSVSLRAMPRCEP